MKTTSRIIRYVLRDLVRSRWVGLYALFFLLLTEALFRFGGSGPHVLLSLVNVVLFLIPLVALFFGTMYLYHARSFVVMLLAQPIRRRALFGGLYLGLTLPLSLGFVLGVGVPFALRGAGVGGLQTLAVLLVAGVGLTFIFLALAFLIANRYTDRVRGLGVAMGVWLVSTVLYDGAVLVVLALFADYPLEGPVLALMLLNPVDLVRVVLLLTFDISALMGYTGAVFQHFLGRGVGILVALLVLAGWLVLPLLAGLHRFEHKDL